MRGLMAALVVVASSLMNQACARCQMWDDRGYVGDRPITTPPPTVTKMICSEETKIPARVYKLEKLTSLEITDSQIGKISSTVRKLVALKSLRLVNCGLTSISNKLNKLSSTLEHLELQDNGLDALPKKFGDLSLLTYLDVSNNALDSLPGDLSDLVALEKLYASQNAISSLDPVASLTALQEIRLADNQVTALPSGLAAAGASLTLLDVSGNQLSSVPDTYSALSMLESVDFSGNAISGLPDSFATENLMTLSLRYNALQEIPLVLQNLPKLEQLTLDGNNITLLPDFLASATHLVYLTLGSNAIAAESLSTVNALTDLNTLVLDNNGLDYLPAGFGEGLVNLRYLDIRNNSLMRLPDSVASLQLDYLQALPNDFCGTLPDLQVAISSDVEPGEEFEPCPATPSPTYPRTIITENCYTPDIKYKGDLIPGVKSFLEAENTEDCHALCVLYRDCNFFSHESKRDRCYLYISVKKTQSAKKSHKWVSAPNPCPTPSPTSSPTLS